MKGIPKSFAEVIRVLAERPDVLQGYCYHIKTYQMGVSCLAEAILNTFTGTFEPMTFRREIAMTYHYWKESVAGESVDKDNVQNFLRLLRIDVIRKIKQLEFSN